MNERAPRIGRSERRSGGRPFERSRDVGHGATFAAIDRELEIHERIVAALDQLDSGDLEVARLNLQWVLYDLDAAA